MDEEYDKEKELQKKSIKANAIHAMKDIKEENDDDENLLDVKCINPRKLLTSTSFKTTKPIEEKTLYKVYRKISDTNTNSIILSEKNNISNSQNNETNKENEDLDKYIKLVKKNSEPVVWNHTKLLEINKNLEEFALYDSNDPKYVIFTKVVSKPILISLSYEDLYNFVTK